MTQNKKDWIILMISYLIIIVVGFLLNYDKGIYYEDLPPNYEPFTAME